MNIFWLQSLLDASYEDIARLYCDAHVGKILLEITQMLYTAWHELDQCRFPGTFLGAIKDTTKPQGYRRTHTNHPMAQWVRKCRDNYMTAATMGLALCREFNVRYPDNKRGLHACADHLVALIAHVPPSIPKTFFMGTREDLLDKWHPPLCMDDAYKVPSSDPKILEGIIQGFIPVRPEFVYDLGRSHQRYYTHCKMFEISGFTYTNVPVPRFVLDGFHDQLRTRVYDTMWPSLRIVLAGYTDSGSPISHLDQILVGRIQRYVLSWPYIKPKAKRKTKRRVEVATKGKKQRKAAKEVSIYC
jgi:hypothetical protein